MASLTLNNVVQNGSEITVNIVLTVKLEGGGISVGMERDGVGGEDRPVFIIPEIENLGIIEEFGKKEN